MTAAAQISESKSPSSHERLLDAALHAWATQGHAATSARSLARLADLPTSSIYHHFGNMERLFQSAQTYAQQESERWCAARLEALPDNIDLPPQALGGLLATLIDDWTTEQRRLAFAWCECYLMAARDPNYVPALHAWHEIWSAFWREACARIGLSQHAVATAYMFDGQSLLHIMPWRRPVDRAALEELCHGWGLWLTGSLAEEGPWRRLAREEAIRTTPDLSLQDGVTIRIAAAAADAVEQAGMAGLTHRAVAARAGLTLGVVSYNFRTASDLARLAFETIYVRAVPSIGLESFNQRDRAEALRTAINPHGSAPGLHAIDELLLAVARDPDLRAFVPQIRYLRGRTSGTMLQAQLGNDQAISPLDAAIYSSFVSGQRRAMLGRSAEDREASAADTATPLLSRLRAAA